MIPKALSLALVAPALAAGALVISASPALAHEPLVAILSGANEVDAGDPGTTGLATVEVEAETGEVCTQVTSNVEGATAMHIHKGAAGTNGPVVVPLDSETINGPRTCVLVATDLAKAIVANPAGFYVNIHTAEKPGGATRGQLTSVVVVGAGLSGASG